jgi:glutathione S-transferase
VTYLEELLLSSPTKGEFFCGSTLSGADIMMCFALEAATGRVPLNETNYPTLYAYTRRMQAREAYKRAGEKVTQASGEDYIPYSDIKM